MKVICPSILFNVLLPVRPFVQKVDPMSEIVTPAFALNGNATPAHAQGAIDLVCAYWASLPRVGLAPHRTALDAHAIAAALPHVFIAELVTPRVARLRLVGHKLEDIMDMDLRGMPLSALFSAASRPVLTDAFEQVARGARVMLPMEGERGFGLPTLTGQLALLPLADGAGSLTRVLGVLDYQGSIGRKPRRLNVTSVTPLTLPQIAEQTSTGKSRSPALRVIIGGKV